MHSYLGSPIRLKSIHARRVRKRFGIVGPNCTFEVVSHDSYVGNRWILKILYWMPVICARIISSQSISSLRFTLPLHRPHQQSHRHRQWCWNGIVRPVNKCFILQLSAALIWHREHCHSGPKWARITQQRNGQRQIFCQPFWTNEEFELWQNDESFTEI